MRHPLIWAIIALFLCPGISGADTELCSQRLPPRYIVPLPDFFVGAATGQIDAVVKGLAEGAAVDSPVSQPPPPELASLFAPHSRGALLLNDPGATALMFAAATGHAEIMALLLGAKADPEARTRSGIHPLDIAAERDDISAMQLLLGAHPGTAAQRLSILIDLSAQRAVLSRDGVPIATTRVSSGRKERPTPRGKFVVTQKYTEWRSTLYHNASMPFFLRLSCSAVGLHQGVVPDYPASHGCIRLPEEMARKFYDLVPRGTVVEIR